MAEPTSLLDRLRALDAELVQPPWMTWLGKHGYPQRVVANDGGLSLIAETYTNPDVPSIDADGIATMRNALPALLRVVEAAEGASARHYHTSHFEPNDEAIVEEPSDCWACDLREALAALHQVDLGAR